MNSALLSIQMPATCSTFEPSCSPIWFPNLPLFVFGGSGSTPKKQGVQIKFLPPPHRSKQIFMPPKRDADAGGGGASKKSRLMTKTAAEFFAENKHFAGQSTSDTAVLWQFAALPVRNPNTICALTACNRHRPGVRYRF